MNRRQFVLGSAAGSALLPAASPASPKTGAGFHLGAVTYEVLKDYDLETILRMLEAASFEGVELRTGHRHGVEPSLTGAERARVRQRFERSKVRLVAYGTACEFHAADPAERRRQVETGKQFADLARDTGAKGIKVRPNGFPAGVPREVTIRNIGTSLRELGDYSAKKGIEVYLEIHGEETGFPKIAAAIMEATRHPNVGVCWNSDPTDVEQGSIRPNFERVKPWIKHVHINELSSDYPWRELFELLGSIRYAGYTMCEAEASKEPERFLSWYRSLWRELNRTCA